MERLYFKARSVGFPEKGRSNPEGNSAGVTTAIQQPASYTAPPSSREGSADVNSTAACTACTADGAGAAVLPQHSSHPRGPIERLLEKITAHSKCPLTLDLLVDPVVAEDGILYERVSSLRNWATSNLQRAPPRRKYIVAKRTWCSEQLIKAGLHPPLQIPLLS